MSLVPTIRFKPFSRASGTMCLLPGSHLVFQCFMEFICVFDYSGEESHLIAAVRFPDLGPLEKFCVMQDHEKEKIIVSGISGKGFIRYEITPTEDPRSWQLFFDKVPETLTLSVVKKDDRELQETHVVHAKSPLAFFYKDVASKPRQRGTKARLFLGVDKSQDWDMVARRAHLAEILPFWFSLAQSLPEIGYTPDPGPSLLQASEFTALFQAAFSHMLVPRLVDTSFHGYALGVVQNTNRCPLTLFPELFSQIRSLFFKEREHVWEIPKPQFVSGTFSNYTTQKGHTISLEWTKGMIRRMLILPSCDDTVELHLQKEVQRPKAPTLKLQQGQSILLDNFLK